MKTAILVCLLALCCGSLLRAHAQEEEKNASKPQGATVAKKVTVTLVRWPYT